MSRLPAVIVGEPGVGKRAWVSRLLAPFAHRALWCRAESALATISGADERSTIVVEQLQRLGLSARAALTARLARGPRILATWEEDARADLAPVEGFPLQTRLAPLRRYPEDIPSLLARFLAVRGVELEGTSADDLQRLQDGAWPRNLRQLEGVADAVAAGASLAKVAREQLPRPRLVLDRDVLLQALATTGSSQTKAAERLGVSRRTVCRKMVEYGLSGPRKSRE